jgi:hypothetical protein
MAWRLQKVEEQRKNLVEAYSAKPAFFLCVLCVSVLLSALMKVGACSQQRFLPAKPAFFLCVL